MSEMTNVVFMVVLSFGLMAYALLWTLRRYSDLVHRREVAGCCFTAWILMVGAMANLNCELKKQITEHHKGAQHAEGIAFALPEVQDYGQSFPRSVSQSEAASGRDDESGRISVVTNGGRFISVSRDRAGHPGDRNCCSDSTRSMSAGTGCTGGTDGGVRHIHGRLGTETTGSCGSTGMLPSGESGIGLKF